MNETAEAKLFGLLLSNLRPPEDALPSVWAERHINITDGERIGPLRFGRGYEYQRDMLDTIYGPYQPGEALRVSCAYKGAQSGVTMLSLIGLLYWACVRGVSVAHMMPRSFDADDKAKKMADMIDASPRLRELVPPGMLRVRKTRAGQSMRVCYSSSAAELKNWQAGVGNIDELDECEVREHDSVSMFLQRMGSYSRQLQFYCGTPTLPDFGIHAKWEASDKRAWWVQCPLCDYDQTLLWENNIDFETEDDHGNPLADDAAAATAELVCADCREPWDFRLRERANAGGEWRATRESSIIGFGMNRLMVPTSIPAQMVLNFLAGGRSDLAMREHYNQDRGLCYLSATGKLDSARVETFLDDSLQWLRIPNDSVYISAGVDVQGEAPPFNYVWELRSYNQEGVASVIGYGIDKEERLYTLFGHKHHGAGMFRPAATLLDITSGHHKKTVDRIVENIPSAQAVRCDHYQKTSFEPGKIVRIKSGGSRGYAIDEDQALEENMSRFFAAKERGQRLRVAYSPNSGLQKEWVEHYTKIARVRESTSQGRDARYRYKKLRPKDVDFPYAGAFADYAHLRLGKMLPGRGGFGAVKRVVKESQAPSKRSARSALHVVRKNSSRRRR